jgi:hypothetical protein
MFVLLFACLLTLAPALFRRRAATDRLQGSPHRASLRRLHYHQRIKAHRFTEIQLSFCAETLLYSTTFEMC